MKIVWLTICFFVVMLVLAGCAQNQKAGQNGQKTDNGSAPRSEPPSRYAMIPASAHKVAPEEDPYPPILESDQYEEPVPLGPPIDSAGAEDSPFITPDGNRMYFFFTPDTAVPAEKQLLDNVTGIYVSRKTASGWDEPERVILEDPGQLALDGCEFVQGQVMWFCSAREGYSGVNFFTARSSGGGWKDISYVGDRLMEEYRMGEMHITSDGTELYFHSDRQGGYGGLDLWVSKMGSDGWMEPENVAPVNSAGDEGWPFISEDGDELWFTRFYQGSPAIFRSLRENGSAWGAPRLMIRHFAGEPTLDQAGDIYFTHHFYKDNRMIEADIYVAKKKQT